MAPRARRLVKNSRKSVMWDRWQQGESLHQIALWLVRRKAFVDTPSTSPYRQDLAATTPFLVTRTDACRARGDLSIPVAGILATMRGRAVGSGPVDDQPEDSTQRQA